jgi:hypothetical protein
VIFIIVNMNNKKECYYTGEGVKPTVVGALWAPPEPPQVCFVSNRYRYRSINELKRAVLRILQWCKL